MAILRSNNPWRGLSAYDEPKEGLENLLFCGRKVESSDVAELLEEHLFVTLYGKSGIGKTSLINAGVFPILRKKHFSPLVIRLGLAQEDDSFQRLLVASIEKEVSLQGGTIKTMNVVPEEEDLEAIDYLWTYFARHIFLDQNGDKVFPVIVLDQFEELFRKSFLREHMKHFLCQCHYLVEESHTINDCIVDGEDYCYDFNFRFLVSIREDDLYYLEEIIDDNYFPILKSVLYRLKSLSHQGATDVVLIPGEGFFSQEDKLDIAEQIIHASFDKYGRISTNMLSLICNRVYEAYYKYNEAVTLPKVSAFLTVDFFAQLYAEATQGLSDSEKQYIETHLIDSAGRRDSISEEDFIKNVPNGESLLQDGPRKILQRVSVSSDIERPRVELIHDSFCAPIMVLSDGRRVAEKSFSIVFKIFFWSIMIFFSFLIIVMCLLKIGII